MIAGQGPKYKWKPNADGKIRSMAEALNLAKQWGITIPDYVDFFIDRWNSLPADTTAKTTTFKEPAGTMIYWSCLLHKKTGKIPFLIRADIMESDEAIVAVIGHEMFELQKLRTRFGNGAPIDHWLAETCSTNPGNFHCMAWDYADELVAKCGERADEDADGNV